MKLIYAIFFTFLITSFYIEALDLFWQGMHTPNMFLHRYAWIFSTLLIYTSAEVLNRLKEIKIWIFLVSLFLIVTGFLATIYLKSHYSFLTDLNILLTLEFFGCLFDFTPCSYQKVYLCKSICHSNLFIYNG